MDEIIKIQKVGKVEIEDFGVIKKADIDFKDGLNVIIGKHATGKTTLIKYLIKSLNKISGGEKIMIQIDNMLGLNQTILMDDFLYCLDKENLVKALNKLPKSGKQAIVTLNIYDWNRVKDKIKANIIDTKNFELKERI